MLIADGFGGLILLALWLFCVIDAITTDAALVRNLPKGVWVLIVLVLFDLGALLWLIAGRPWTSASPTKRGTASSAFPEYDRPGRYVPPDAAADESFLRSVRERAEQQRREYQVKRQQELDDERQRLMRRPAEDEG